MPLQEFFQWIKVSLYIRASANFFFRLKSTKILLFPAELYAEMLVFEKLHKLIDNWNYLSRSENFCMVKTKFLLSFVSFPTQREIWKKYNFYEWKKKLLSFFCKCRFFNEIFDQNSSFCWLLLPDSGVLEEIFVKNVWKISVKTAILFENFVKTDLEKETWVVCSIYS